MDAVTIADVDQTLSDWIESIAGAGVDVRLTVPADSDEKPSVNLYLADIATSVPAQHDPARVLNYSLGYLVTTAGPKPEQAHRLFDLILRAALGHDGFQPDINPPTAEFWSALGTPPRPSFWLRVPLAIERPQRRPVKRVEHPADIRFLPRTSLAGVIVGPGEIPIPRARVELPALDQLTYTDSRGRFRFPAVPAEPHIKQLKISAKGYEYTQDQPHDPVKPVVIHLALKEK